MKVSYRFLLAALSYLALVGCAPKIIHFPHIPIPTSTAQFYFCALSFINPSQNYASLPNFGPVVFSWTSQIYADHYELVISGPNVSPVSYFTANTSKTLYMENYPLAGTYKAVVKAMSDSPAQLLCTATIYFTKDALKIPNPKGGPVKLPTPIPHR